MNENLLYLLVGLLTPLILAFLVMLSISFYFTCKATWNFIKSIYLLVTAARKLTKKKEA